MTTNGDPSDPAAETICRDCSIKANNRGSDEHDGGAKVAPEWDLGPLCPIFTQLWRTDDAAIFDELLGAIDEADLRLRR